MAVIETWLQTDLKKPVQVKQLGGHLFSADNQGNLIGVVIKDNGIPAEGLSGGVFGYAIRPDNETVVIEGTLSGNRASILLPASCYAIVGPISIVIKLGTTTVGACTGNVYRTTTDTIVDPGSVIPDISELLAKIADCEAATVRANTASNGAERVNASMSKSGDVITIAMTDRDGVVTEEELTDQSNAVEELEKVVQAQGIYIETESQPIVSISDGADDQPMRKVEVSIEPVQDLHGYDHPWPGGGSKNLAYKIIEKTAISSSGVIVNDNTFSLACAKVTSGETYTFSDNGTAVTPNVVAYYDSDPEIGSVSYNGSRSTGIASTFTAEHTGYVCLRFTTSSVTNCQIESGSSATSYIPYSNICPISGWTGAKVTRTGINIWDEEWEVGGLGGGDNITRSDRIRSKNYIQIVPGTTYYLVVPSTYTGNFWISYYTADKTFISGSNTAGTTIAQKNETFTAPDNACFMRFQLTATDTYGSDISINYPATNTEYHAYQGQTYEVTFPADPGTVYGGTLDVVSGKLVVNKAIVDLGTLNYSQRQNTNIFYATVDIGAPIISPQNSYAICENYYNAKVTWSEIISGQFSYGQNIIGNGRCVAINDKRYASSSEFKTAMSGVHLVYGIASPIEYTLTPTEIKTLLGANNIWSDAGNTTVTYPADTKMYIDNRINSTRKLIAGIETSFVASKAYAVGDMLIIGDDLYKVASSISSGATITVGTNVTKTTVAEQLLALANA